MMVKEIDMAGAVDRLANGTDGVCAVIPITRDTKIEWLIQAKAFVLVAKDKPKAPETPEKPAKAPAKAQAIDHGKIIALYKAGWSLTKIADEIGCSAQTVRNHIAQEEAKNG